MVDVLRNEKILTPIRLIPRPDYRDQLAADEDWNAQAGKSGVRRVNGKYVPVHNESGNQQGK